MVMDDITLLLSILIAGFSGLLFIVSIAAYNRIRSVKLLFISLAFFMFIVKGLLLIFEIFVQDKIMIAIDFVILILLYFASVKK
jgi:hypothetical protein